MTRNVVLITGATAGIGRAAALAFARDGTEMLERIAGGADKIAAVAEGIPAGRIGTPEEVADAIVFLASERSRCITGQVLAVNGGKTAT